MTLLHPALFLAGAACIAIPIVIHLLLRQRRKPVPWAAMRFLLEAYRRQRRKLKIQQILLLVCRCVVLALLAFALGRPLLRSAGLIGGSSGRLVYVLVDNGLASSIREGESGSALDRHKDAAGSLLGSLGPGDRVALIALGAPADAVVLPVSSEIGAVRDLMMDLEVAHGPADLRGALELVASDLDASPEESPEALVVILSDFLAGSAPTAVPLPPVLAARPNLRILAGRPATDAPGNVQVTGLDVPAVMLTAQGEQSRRQQVRVTLRRTGAATAEGGISTLRVQARPVGEQAPAAPPTVRTTVTWAPGQSEASVPVPLDITEQEAGAARQALLVAEIDRDAIAADNSYRRPVRLRAMLRVGIVARRRFGRAAMTDLQPADWYRFAVQPEENAPVELIDLDPASIDAPTLATLDAAFVAEPDLLSGDGWSLLRGFAERGGLILLSPPAHASVNLWTDALAKGLGLDWRLQREPVTHDDAPRTLQEESNSRLLRLIRSEVKQLARPVVVFKTLGFEEPPKGVEVLLAFADGEPLLVAQTVGGQSEETARGLVLYLAVAPEITWTNLPLTPLMVPLMQEVLRQGVGRAAGSSSALAGRRALTPSGAARLHTEDGRTLEVGPDGLVAEPLRRAGLYRALDNADRARGTLAVNADPTGGDTSPTAAGALESWLGGAAGDDAERAVRWVDAGDVGGALAQESTGSPISLPLLIGALAFAILELVLARLFSYVRPDSDRAVVTPAAGPALGGAR